MSERHRPGRSVREATRLASAVLSNDAAEARRLAAEVLRNNEARDRRLEEVRRQEQIRQRMRDGLR